MKQPPKWALLLLASAGSWAATQGCHEFHACDDGQCKPLRGTGDTGGSSFAGTGGTTHGGAPGEGGGAGQAGASGGASPDAAEAGAAGATDGGAGGEGGAARGEGGGAGGEGGAAGCVAPLADCDESTFSGCESNLLVDVRNCGACRARCAGACIAGQCSPFEVLAEDMRLPAWGGIVSTSTEVYASSRSFPSSLVRWSAQQGAQTLFTNGDEFQQILGGADRLYLLGRSLDDQLSSIPRSGGVVSAEGITARAATMLGRTLYAVDNAGVPYWRDEINHTTGTLPLPTPLPHDVRVWLAADSSRMALVAEAGGDGAATYTVDYLAETDVIKGRPWVRLTSGVGRPAQVRVDGQAVYIDVVLAHAESLTDNWQIAHELRQVDFDGATRVVSSLTGLLDFELVSRRLYLSVELPQYASVLRVVPLDDPRRVLDVQTSSSMASLTFSWPFFYFGDTSRSRLARLPAWLE